MGLDIILLYDLGRIMEWPSYRVSSNCGETGNSYTFFPKKEIGVYIFYSGFSFRVVLG